MKFMNHKHKNDIFTFGYTKKTTDMEALLHKSKVKRIKRAENMRESP